MLHPDVTFRALRELGSPVSALLPAGYPMLAATLFGLPPLAADSFDADVPVRGLVLQSGGADPGFVLGLHLVSGPEFVAKLSTGSAPPFRVAPGPPSSPTVLQASVPADAGANASSALALGVFDNYLLVASSPELLTRAGPYVARTLSRHAPPNAPVSFTVSKQGLADQVVPALRARWASYRTNLERLDRDSRSAHGGRAPDFADPAAVILGADSGVESVLSLLEGASGLDLTVEPTTQRVVLTLLLTPGAANQNRLVDAVETDSQALLSLPESTFFALSGARSAAEMAASDSNAGQDWAELLGSRLSEHDAKTVREVLSNWQHGRGTQTTWAALGGAEPGAALVTTVRDRAALEHAAHGLFGLFALPGVRAPLTEFLGQPSVVESSSAVVGLDGPVAREKLTFATGGKKVQFNLPALDFAWRVTDQTGFAVGSKAAAPLLGTLVQAAHGAGPTLGTNRAVAEGVARASTHAGIVAYVDLRALGATSAASEPAALFLSLGRQGNAAFLRVEVSKPAVDFAIHGALGQ